MSASSNCVTWGTVVQDSVIRWAMVRRSGDILSRVVGPHLARSRVSRTLAAGAAAAVDGVSAIC